MDLLLSLVTDLVDTNIFPEDDLEQEVAVLFPGLLDSLLHRPGFITSTWS